MDIKLLTLCVTYYINKPVLGVFDEFIEIANKLYADNIITEKEKVIFELRAKDDSFAGIAKDLNESVGTVTSLFSNVFREVKKIVIEKNKTSNGEFTCVDIIDEPLSSIFKFFSISTKLSKCITRELIDTHKINNPYLKDMEMLYALKCNDNSYNIAGLGKTGEEEWKNLMDAIAKLKSEKVSNSEYIAEKEKTNMKKSIMYALNSMNYLFLREVFGRNTHKYDHKEDCSLNGVVLEELSLFLGEISKEGWSDEFTMIARTELDEGTYFDDIVLEDALERLKETITEIFGELDEDLYKAYKELFEEVYNNQ